MSNDIVQQFQLLTGGVSLMVLFFGILWWLLCIILFFKVWGMTNNVNKMKDMLQEWLDIEHPITKEGDVEQEDQKVTTK